MSHIVQCPLSFETMSLCLQVYSVGAIYMLASSNPPLNTRTHTPSYFFHPSMYPFGGVSARIQRERLHAEGMGTNERALKFLNQDYEALKQECLESGCLFEDPCFPTEPSSLGFKELAPHSSKTQGVEWMRPTVRD